MFLRECVLFPFQICLGLEVESTAGYHCIKERAEKKLRAYPPKISSISLLYPSHLRKCPIHKYLKYVEYMNEVHFADGEIEAWTRKVNLPKSGPENQR